MRTIKNSALKSSLFICLCFAITTIALAAPEPPSRPGTPVYNDYWSDGCVLAYLVPHSDGGLPIINYIIEYKVSAWWGGSWKIKGTSTNLTYRVMGMVEDSSAVFRVRAENKAGAGEPSEPSVEITFKNRL